MANGGYEGQRDDPNYQSSDELQALTDSVRGLSRADLTRFQALERAKNVKKLSQAFFQTIDDFLSREFDESNEYAVLTALHPAAYSAAISKIESGLALEHRRAYITLERELPLYAGEDVTPQKIGGQMFGNWRTGNFGMYTNLRNKLYRNLLELIREKNVVEKASKHATMRESMPALNTYIRRYNEQNEKTPICTTSSNVGQRLMEHFQEELEPKYDIALGGKRVVVNTQFTETLTLVLTRLDHNRDNPRDPKELPLESQGWPVLGQAIAIRYDTLIGRQKDAIKGQIKRLRQHHTVRVTKRSSDFFGLDDELRTELEDL